tara:strand:+ start:2231 stop:2998 length:768 start_codon:yes stop_codon:yes gene_type:complete
MKKHISFSELKNWDFCPFYHKLVNLDGLRPFKGNIFTAFGSALHESCEKNLLKEIKQADMQDYFCESFLREINKIPEEVEEERFVEFLKQGTTLVSLAIPELKKHFGVFEVIGVEERLYEKMEDVDYIFKGFIDLIIRTPDQKYHIIDWKTCSWGWDSRKKADPMVIYQIVLYKNYYAKKYNIDMKDIETYFALLKRTAKKDKVEFLRVTSGPKRVKNSLDKVKKAVYNIKNKNFIKNKLKCENCEFYRTSHCPR